MKRIHILAKVNHPWATHMIVALDETSLRAIEDQRKTLLDFISRRRCYGSLAHNAIAAEIYDLPDENQLAFTLGEDDAMILPEDFDHATFDQANSDWRMKSKSACVLVHSLGTVCFRVTADDEYIESRKVEDLLEPLIAALAPLPGIQTAHAILDEDFIFAIDAESAGYPRLEVPPGMMPFLAEQYRKGLNPVIGEFYQGDEYLFFIEGEELRKGDARLVSEGWPIRFLIFVKDNLTAEDNIYLRLYDEPDANLGEPAFHP